MRRTDRQITDPGHMETILQNAACLRLGLVDGGLAYIVPMSFGMRVEDGKLCLYFHSAPQGRKIELIEEAGIASFEADTDIGIIQANQACAFSSSYQSVMGHGKIEILHDEADKLHALRILMEHYTGQDAWEIPTQSLDGVAAIKLTVEAMTGKASPASEAL